MTDRDASENAHRLMHLKFPEQEATARAVLAAAPDILSYRDHIGRNVLHHAIGDARKEVTLFLVENGTDVTAQDNHGDTPLHYLALGPERNGRKFTIDDIREIGDALLTRGAAIDARQNGDSTPLHYAVMEDRADIVAWLLERGADPSPKNLAGLEPRGHARALISQSAYPNDNCAKIIALLDKAEKQSREQRAEAAEKAVRALLEKKSRAAHDRNMAALDKILKKRRGP